MSLLPLKGICVAEPVEIVVFKNLFIDLKMPYSAVRGEQLEIKAIIHNYTPDNRKVNLILSLKHETVVMNSACRHAE